MKIKIRHTLTTKFSLLFATFAIGASAFLYWASYLSYRNSMLEHYGRYAASAAELAAAAIDPEDLLRYAETLKRDTHYDAVEKELDSIRKNLGIKYLYVQMPITDSEYMYLFDLYDPEDTSGGDTSLGARGAYDENFATAKIAMKTGEPARELDITHSEYGYLASAYAPIPPKSSGRLPFAYVGVDISMEFILGIIMRYLGDTVAVTCAVVGVCLAVLFFFIKKTVLNPVHAIAAKAEEFTRKVNDPSFEDLKICSKDEIGDLTASVNAMFRDIRDFTIRMAEEMARRERIQKFNENLQKTVEEKNRKVMELQRAILKTVADLVESRDNITGGHVERTQHGLKVLIEGLEDLGLYREQMKGWDIELLLQSSQLHDVGKISIVDSILNKPGRLTQEEFEEIKNHTTIGVQIIERIEAYTSENEFLKYAKIFAGTHHEKWDGTGYPTGMAGEEIPLQGRLMAIADVYDALASDRPYKKAYPHEEAVQIILDGKGTHFDPILIDVFERVADQFVVKAHDNEQLRLLPLEEGEKAVAAVFAEYDRGEEQNGDKNGG